MRKKGFLLMRFAENKAADQLCSNCIADQGLCFRFTDTTIPPLRKTKISRFFSVIVSDLVGISEDPFSRVLAQIIQYLA